MRVKLLSEQRDVLLQLVSENLPQKQILHQQHFKQRNCVFFASSLQRQGEQKQQQIKFLLSLKS